ncbi:hypothetical protein EBR57_00825 [bacterium]|nr:hypothetical protein [bacterium]
MNNQSKNTHLIQIHRKYTAIPQSSLDWTAVYTRLQQTTAQSDAALLRQWLWIRQHGSAIAPASDIDQKKLGLSQAPFVKNSSYLRTDATAYLLPQIEEIKGILGIGDIIAAIPHSGVEALEALYSGQLVVIGEDAILSNKEKLIDACKNSIPIWIRLTTPNIPRDIKDMSLFSSILRKLPKLATGQKYKLLWSFSTVQKSGIPTELPLTILCGKKHFLPDHLIFLPHSGYTPDKASIDVMLIKLYLRCTNLRGLETGFNTQIRTNLTRTKPPQPSVSTIVYPKRNSSLYQQLGTRWRSRFETIKNSLRADFIDKIPVSQKKKSKPKIKVEIKPEIQTLIATLETTLRDAQNSLNSPLLTDQYGAIRTMGDIMLVAETLCDTERLAPRDFSQFGAYLPDQVVLTSYGMTALTGAILAYKATVPQTPNITTMAHTYFETSGIIETIATIQPNFCIHQPGFETVNTIPLNSDIILIEPHPNNVTAKPPIHSPSLDELASRVRTIVQETNRAAPLLVLMDITIGLTSDPKLVQFIETVRDLIDAQKLHVVMGQSLVKFGALGIDVASAGLLLVWSNSPTFKAQANRFLNDATPPDHVQAFYKHVLTDGLDLAKTYLDTIRQNTQFLSDRILEKLAEINLEKREIRVMDIHPNLDRGTCYIGITFDGLMPQFNDGTSAETVAKKVSDTIKEITGNEDITLTSRSSFGFPFCNINVIGGAIRLTVGIESQETLTQLADVITIVALGLIWDTKRNTPQFTTEKLVEILNTTVDIAHKTRTGFSKVLRAIYEVCIGEYETEDGLDPDFDWQELGTGTLSWKPGESDFSWKFEDESPQPIGYLEIGNGYGTNATSQPELAIALLAINDSDTLLDGHQINATIPHVMDRFAEYAFGKGNHPLIVWTQEHSGEPTIRTIKITNVTTFDDQHYPANRVMIHQNGAEWKQSELAGKALETWKSQLTSGLYSCHWQVIQDVLHLRLELRTNAETWKLPSKSLSIRIGAQVPIRVDGHSYTWDQVYIFGQNKLKRVGGYWSIKKILDIPQTEKNNHISQCVTTIRETLSEGEPQNILILVPESERASYESWQSRLK